MLRTGSPERDVILEPVEWVEGAKAGSSRHGGSVLGPGGSYGPEGLWYDPPLRSPGRRESGSGTGERCSSRLGQVLGDIYMTDGDSSLDDIGRRLDLSKAAVSIAARQLESLGLLQRIWKKGDRRNYYRLIDHLGKALRQGFLEMVRIIHGDGVCSEQYARISYHRQTSRDWKWWRWC